MKNKERPSGYIQQFIAHTNPIQSLPPPPIIERKEAETLMSHCLKQFIRERLYGNMINYSRQTNAKHELGLSSLLPKIKMTKTNNYDSDIDISEIISKRKSTVQRYNSIKKNGQKTNEKQINNQKRRSNSSLGSCNAQKNKRKEDFIQQLQEKGRSKKNQKKNNQKKCTVESQIQNVTSFISAIQEQNLPVSLIEQKKKLNQSSRIQEQNRRIGKREKDKKIKFGEGIKLKKGYWQQFCLISEKTYLNIENSEKQQFKVASSRSKFIKDSYINYIEKNLQLTCLPIIQTYNFFQMSNKVKDNMTAEDYKKVITKMANSGERVWAFLGFRFWDRDKDGLISNNDIFQTYKKIDQIKQKVKEKEFNEKEKVMTFLQDITKMVSRFNLRLSELQIIEEKVKIYPKNDEKIQSKQEQIYLEESFLKNEHVKYNDLQLILGEKTKVQKQNSKNSVIESTKDLGIKFSSCYRYSFMATDHNEVTRENREKVENMKEKIKKKYEIEEIMQCTTKGKKANITYTEFLNRRYFGILRRNILQAFGIDLNSIKM